MSPMRWCAELVCRIGIRPGTEKSAPFHLIFFISVRFFHFCCGVICWIKNLVVHCYMWCKLKWIWFVNSPCSLTFHALKIFIVRGNNIAPVGVKCVHIISYLVGRWKVFLKNKVYFFSSVFAKTFNRNKFLSIVRLSNLKLSDLML